MVHGKKRIPYWIDWRLPGLAGPEYHAVISFGLPIEPEDSQYGEYRLQGDKHTDRSFFSFKHTFQVPDLGHAHVAAFDLHDDTLGLSAVVKEIDVTVYA